MAWASPARAQVEGAAVLALGDAPEAPDLAQKLRAALEARGTPVLTLEQTRGRLLGLPSGEAVPPPLTGERVLARQERADRARDEGHNEDALAQYTALLADLDRDPDIGPQTAQMAQRIRVSAALMHLALAGRTETGQGNTPHGKAALDLLYINVATDPSFVLDLERFPPRLRSLLERARSQAAQSPRGSLEVTCTLPGATIYLEGRALGLAPLRLSQVAPFGRWRVWVEHLGRRSMTRLVDLGPEWTHLHVDVALEGSIRARDAALDLELVDLQAQTLNSAAVLLGVRYLAVAVARPQAVGLLVYDLGARAVLRQGQLDGSLPESVEALAAMVDKPVEQPGFAPLALRPQRVATPKRVMLVGETDEHDAEAFRGGAKQNLKVAFTEVAEARASQARCGNAVPCLLDAARAAGADALVMFSVQGTGAVTADAVWFELEKGSPVRRVAEEVRRDGWTPARIHSLAGWLLAPDRQQGTLTLQGERSGMRVWVDGWPLEDKAAGTLSVPLGIHILRVTQPGMVEAEARVRISSVEPGVVTLGRAEGRLFAKVPATGPRAEARRVAQESSAGRSITWWPLGLVGGGVGMALLSVIPTVVGAAVGVAFGLRLASFEVAPNGSVVATSTETRQQRDLRVLSTVGLLAGGGALAAVGLLATLAALTTAGVGLVLWLVL